MRFGDRLRAVQQDADPNPPGDFIAGTHGTRNAIPGWGKQPHFSAAIDGLLNPHDNLAIRLLDGLGGGQAGGRVFVEPADHRRRLHAVLEMRRLDPDGNEPGPDAYVSGNALGEPGVSKTIR